LLSSFAGFTMSALHGSSKTHKSLSTSNHEPQESWPTKGEQERRVVDQISNSKKIKEELIRTYIVYQWTTLNVAILQKNNVTLGFNHGPSYMCALGNQLSIFFLSSMVRNSHFNMNKWGV
jgi:hypothetical protein